MIVSTRATKRIINANWIGFQREFAQIIVAVKHSDPRVRFSSLKHVSTAGTTPQTIRKIYFHFECVTGSLHDRMALASKVREREKELSNDKNDEKPALV